MKKLILMLLVVVLGAAVLAGCGKPDEQILGEWREIGPGKGTLVFREDGILETYWDGEMYTTDGYRLEGNEVYVSSTEDSGDWTDGGTLVYSMKDGDKLYVIYGKTAVQEYEKVKD